MIFLWALQNSSPRREEEEEPAGTPCAAPPAALRAPGEEVEPPLEQLKRALEQQQHRVTVVVVSEHADGKESDKDGRKADVEHPTLVHLRATAKAKFSL